MKDLTLVIPAKYEATTLPIVLEELKKYNLTKNIVIPSYDTETLKAISGYDCNIILQKGEGFGSALIEGIESVESKCRWLF